MPSVVKSLKPAFIVVVMLTVIGVLAVSAEACPTCKDGIQSGENAANVVAGYFWSIVFMMSMPFLIFGSLVTYFYLQIRKARAGAGTTAANRRVASTNTHRRQLVHDLCD